MSEAAENLKTQRKSKRYSTVVCVTGQYSCDEHIKKGRILADLTDTDLVVVHIASAALDGAPLDYLYGVASQNGAVMNVIYDDKASKALIRFIKNGKIRNIITGVPTSAESIAVKLWETFTHITFFTVDSAGNMSSISSPRRAAMAMPKSAAMQF